VVLAGHDNRLLQPPRTSESGGKGALRVIVHLGVELRARVAANDPRASALVAGASVWVRLPRD
jgi:hypothetical protein